MLGIKQSILQFIQHPESLLCLVSSSCGGCCFVCLFWRKQIELWFKMSSQDPKEKISKHKDLNKGKSLSLSVSTSRQGSDRDCLSLTYTQNQAPIPPTERNAISEVQDIHHPHYSSFNLKIVFHLVDPAS